LTKLLSYLFYKLYERESHIIITTNYLYYTGVFMNRRKLIEVLSEETAFSRRDITKVLDAFLRVLIRVLKKSGKVQWSGFGTFSIAKRAARKGINPATKQSISLPEIYVPKFKAGKLLKETIRSVGERKKSGKESATVTTAVVA
jgi:DNA-binding protein HU-beta